MRKSQIKGYNLSEDYKKLFEFICHRTFGKLETYLRILN